MPSKKFLLTDNLAITVTKRSTSRRIRLSIASDGALRASIPPWLPYIAGLSFAQKNANWIQAKLPPKRLLEPGRQVGKNHRLVFKPTAGSRISIRLNSVEAMVLYPDNMSYDHQDVQSAAQRIIGRALKRQAEHLLPIRLNQLAAQHGFSYGNIRIKSLKSRWGSCDKQANITLNLYLMELPWGLIDYVLIHELNHTVIMQHGSKFWQALETKLPNYKLIKKQLKNYPTVI